MKNIIILLTFLWAITSYAVAPYGIKGQQQAATLYSNVHQFPNNQVTNLGGINALVETGNNNILSNPNFEHSTFSTSWTNSAGTFTQETSVVIDGKASAKLVLSAQTMSLTQSSTLYAAQFADGVQGLAMVRIKSDIALKVCSIQAGTVSTTNCVTTATDSKWGLYKIPFVMGATSQGVSIASTGSVTGTVYVDDAFVGAINLESQNGACITADCTTTFSAKISAAGIVSGKNVDWISGNCTMSGASSETATCAFNSSIFTVEPNCSVVCDSSADCQLTKGSASSSSQVIIAGANSLGTAAARSFEIICQKQGADFTQAEAKKTGNVFTTQCGANCVDVYSAVIASTTTDVVTSENVDFINGNCTTATVGRSTCTFNSGLVTQQLSCSCTTVINAANRSCAVLVQSSTSVLVSTTSGGVEADGIGFNLICQKQGADFVATRNIVGSFSEIPTTKGSNGADIQSVYFGSSADCSTACTTGNCTVCNQVGSKITSVSFAFTGQYNLNGIDGTKYNCTFNAVIPGSGPAIPFVDRVSSTSSFARVRATNNLLAATNTANNSAICIGIP